jgi:adenylate cyclase
MAVRYRHSYFLLAVATAAAVVLVPLLAPRAIAAVRNFVFDRFQQAAPRIWNPDLPVRVVDIDEESIRRIGQWPWPRAKLGQLVDRLREEGAAVVAFDIVLSEPDRTNLSTLLTQIEPPELRAELAARLENVPTSDAIFAEALSRQPAVLGAIATNMRQDSGAPLKFGLAWAGGDGEGSLARFAGALHPLPMFSEKAAGVGVLNWLPDTDQIVRTVPLLLRAGDMTLPGLALESLRLAQNASTYLVRTAQASGEARFSPHGAITGVRVGDLQIPTGSRGDVRVHFTPHRPERFIPAWTLLAGEAGAERKLDGAVIFIGASAEGLLDQRATPIDPLVPGVEVHAQVAESLIEGGLLSRPDWAPGLEIAVAVLLCVLVFALVKAMPPLAMMAFSAATTVSLLAASWFLFREQSLLIDPAYPGGSALMALGVSVVHSLWTETAQKREIRNAFERFVSPAVVARLSKDPSRLVLGGEIRDITILFSDMRSFTALSETMDAQELTQFMNDYLTPMSDLVLAHGGTIDKYIGDAIMAFWNAPLDDPDHARNAVKAAQAMQVALDRLNEGWQDAAKSAGRTFPIVSTGTGLHLGSCCVGNLGSSRRFDYSAIGDPVNVTARLESLTKELGLDLLVSDSVRSQVPEMAWLEIGFFRLKGKSADLRVFTLLGDAEMRNLAAFRQFEERQHAFLTAYAVGAFAEADTILPELIRFGSRDFRKLHAFYLSQREAGFEAVENRPSFIMLSK